VKSKTPVRRVPRRVRQPKPFWTPERKVAVTALVVGLIGVAVAVISYVR
jgi:hypothetical protein